MRTVKSADVRNEWFQCFREGAGVCEHDCLRRQDRDA